MKIKQILLTVVISISSAVGSMWVYQKMTSNEKGHSSSTAVSPNHIIHAGFSDNIATVNTPDPVDFTKAASMAVPTVVHIKTTINARKISNTQKENSPIDNWMDHFFQLEPHIQPEQRASGSGVILSHDGYIVTNNHVVSNSTTGNVADEITVTLSNKKTYKAKVVGRNASSDLAVIKIDASNLPFITTGNSDAVKLGQWVLAVGYPLNLEATVTAGIISAKGRSIGINTRQSNTPIESFIQTDAVINQGNSGGALITTDGQLVGINAAMLSPNGTYAGYGFSIPVNLVKKIVSDLIRFGDVKQAYLGISPVEEKLDATDGAHLADVTADGPAKEAGLIKGDMITAVNDVVIHSWAELQGQIASLNAGEKIRVVYVRNGKTMTTTIVLKNAKPVTASVDQSSLRVLSEKLGATLSTLSTDKAKQLGIHGGVSIHTIKEAGLLGKSRMEEGFVIIAVNDVLVNSIEELARQLERSRGNVKLNGIYPGDENIYQYPLTWNSY